MANFSNPDDYRIHPILTPYLVGAGHNSLPSAVPIDQTEAASTANLPYTYVPNVPSGKDSFTGVVGILDGVILQNNDRVLIKDQTVKAQNGVYFYNSVSSAFVRTDDFDRAASPIAMNTVVVVDGGTQAGSEWGLVYQVKNVGTDPVIFSEAGATFVGIDTILGSGGILVNTVGDTSTVSISPSYTGQTSITTVGTITTGTWQGSTVQAGFGGTGQSSYIPGDLLVATGIATLGKLSDAAVGNALLSGGAGVAPSYGKVSLTNTVSGVLPVANGGTGASTAVTAFNALSPLTTTGDLLTWSGGNNIRFGAGANGTVLSSTGSALNWIVPVSSVSGTANRITVTNGTTTPVVDVAATYVGQTSITTVGTVGTGVWQGSAIAIAFGGTGAGTALAGFNNLSPLTTKGDIVVFNGSNNVRLPVGSNNQVLIADSTQATGLRWGADPGGTLYSAGQVNPTGTMSLVQVMAGIGVPFTPSASGKTLVTFCGAMNNDTGNGDGVIASLRFGTGTAPINGAAMTGTQLSNPCTFSIPAAGNTTVPFNFTAAAALTAGTVYWFDLAFAATTGGTASLIDVTATVVEV